MSTKRLALAGMIAVALTLTACTGTNGPEPTDVASESATPTPTVTSFDPPADEDEAIENADAAVSNWLVVRGEVNAAGGTDVDRLEQLSTGRALEITLNDAATVANGPVLNEDGQQIDGPATTEGAFVHETLSAYAQEYEGIANGLVTINACQDASGYSITTNDGSPAMRPENLRALIDYQVVYDAERRAWLVYDVVSLNQPC